MMQILNINQIQLQNNFSYLSSSLKDFFSLEKFNFSTLIVFLIILLCFIIFVNLGITKLEIHFTNFLNAQLNLADRAQSDNQNTQGSGENAQPSQAGSSTEPPKKGEGGESKSGSGNEQRNESTETQEFSLQPYEEGPTPGEEAGLSAYEEGVLTMCLNRTFKRNKQKKKR